MRRQLFEFIRKCCKCACCLYAPQIALMQKEMSGLRLELEEREDKIDEYEERIAELTQQLGEDGLKRSMD